MSKKKPHDLVWIARSAARCSLFRDASNYPQFPSSGYNDAQSVRREPALIAPGRRASAFVVRDTPSLSCRSCRYLEEQCNGFNCPQYGRRLSFSARSHSRYPWKRAVHLIRFVSVYTRMERAERRRERKRDGERAKKRDRGDGGTAPQWGPECSKTTCVSVTVYGRLLQEMIIAGIPTPRTAAQFVLIYLLLLSSYQLPPLVRLELRQLPLFARASSY